MSLSRLLRATTRAALCLVPRRLHTRGMAAKARVLTLSAGQRRELARNLAGMLRP
jgi:hypothetical protein